MMRFEVLLAEYAKKRNVCSRCHSSLVFTTKATPARRFRLEARSRQRHCS